MMQTILVADDNHEMCNVIKEILTTVGYEVLIANNGKEAVSLCRTNTIDLLITDIFMPEQDGLETIDMLRDEFPSMKFIAISGDSSIASDTYMKTAEYMGAFDVLRKPFQIEDLLGAINKVLHGGNSSPHPFSTTN
ncbi:MAG: response regulator [Desulfobulbaceae bacterium]|nr:response regulator [Desulfobulbaceae bacterium]